MPPFITFKGCSRIVSALGAELCKADCDADQVVELDVPAEAFPAVAHLLAVPLAAIVKATAVVVDFVDGGAVLTFEWTTRHVPRAVEEHELVRDAAGGVVGSRVRKYVTA